MRFLPLKSRQGLREICLLTFNGGEISYCSDGNWIVPDTTCLSLSLSSSHVHHYSPIYLLSHVCHNWFLLTAVLDNTSCTRHKLSCVSLKGSSIWTRRMNLDSWIWIKIEKNCVSMMALSNLQPFWLGTIEPPTPLGRSRWPGIQLFKEKPMVASCLHRKGS